MKGGIRIVHASARNAVVIIHNLKRPLQTPVICSFCQNVHQAKTYHIRVDDEGASIVSETVFEGLKSGGAINDKQFMVGAHIKNPPARILGRNGEVIQRKKITLYGN